VSDLPDTEVIIVGGGLGGLAAGLALRQRQVEAIILEQAETIEQIQTGIGMVLWPNGMRALDRLGVADGVAAEANELEALLFCSRSGSELRRLTVEHLKQALGQPTVAFVRRRLHQLLTERIPDGMLHMGARCESLTQDASGVTVSLVDGRQVRGSVLVAADGVHSGLRAKVLGIGGPAFPPYRYTVWHTVIPFPDRSLLPEGIFFLYFGRGVRFNVFRVSRTDDSVYWSALAYVDEGFEERGDTVSFLLDRFRDFASPVPELIEAGRSARIERMGIFGEQSVERWGDARFTLLGDAAHPLTTVLGQGAGQALEDAMVLSQTLGDGSASVAALREYERRRMERSSQVIELVHTLSSAATQESPLRTWFRDQILIKRLFPLSPLGRGFDRLIIGAAEEF
jgi:2-polyprenyl-6-methoxyphenol hydroxylase-like FAD-dependent oxidoreductase